MASALVLWQKMATVDDLRMVYGRSQKWFWREFGLFSAAGSGRMALGSLVGLSGG